MSSVGVPVAPQGPRASGSPGRWPQLIAHLCSLLRGWGTGGAQREMRHRCGGGVQSQRLASPTSSVPGTLQAPSASCSTQTPTANTGTPGTN